MSWKVLLVIEKFLLKKFTSCSVSRYSDWKIVRYSSINYYMATDLVAHLHFEHLVCITQVQRQEGSEQSEYCFPRNFSIYVVVYLRVIILVQTDIVNCVFFWNYDYDVFAKWLTFSERTIFVIYDLFFGSVAV